MAQQEELAKLRELILTEKGAVCDNADDVVEKFMMYGTIPDEIIQSQEPFTDCTSSDCKIEVSELEGIHLSF